MIGTQIAPMLVSFVFGQSMLNYEVVEDAQRFLKVTCRSLPSTLC